MSSIAQIEANGRNAEKSTGPRTPEGKAVSSRNATRHGLLSRDVVVAGENEEEFLRHRSDLFADLQPSGATERLLAERFVEQAWRLRRVARIEGRILEERLAEYGILEEEPEEAPPEGDTGRRCEPAPPRRPFQGAGEAMRRRSAIGAMFLKANEGLDVLRRYERAIERGFFAALRDLKALQKDRRKNGREAGRGDAGRGDAREVCETNPIRQGTRGDAGDAGDRTEEKQEGASESGRGDGPLEDSNRSPLTSNLPRRRKVTTWIYDPDIEGGKRVEERWEAVPESGCETNPIREEIRRDEGSAGDRKRAGAAGALAPGQARAPTGL